MRGGNYELPMGTSLRELIFDIGGGIPDGRELKAVIPGGSSVPVLTADQIDAPLDFDSMAEAGTMLGSGAVIVIDDRCCMVQLGLRVAQFYKHESCGKCTPCREGTRWMVQILRAIEEGRAGQGDLDLLLDVCDRILGKCLCPLGDAAAMPVASYVDKFRAEFQAHIDDGSCPLWRLVFSRPACSRRSTSTRTAPRKSRHDHVQPCAHEHLAGPVSELVTLTIDGRDGAGAEGDRARRDAPRPPGSRFRSSATSRASARRSAPAGCASSRSRGCRSSRPAARSPRPRGWP